MLLRLPKLFGALHIFWRSLKCKYSSSLSSLQKLSGKFRIDVHQFISLCCELLRLQKLRGNICIGMLCICLQSMRLICISGNVLG